MKRPYSHFFREIEHAYHNDKPLYWTLGTLIAVFTLIALAIKLNS